CVARLLHRLRPGRKRHRIERTGILTNFVLPFSEMRKSAARLDNRTTMIYVHVMFEIGSGVTMPTSEDWLYRRLQNEPVRKDERKRWNSVVSRLRRLTEVDESTQQLWDEHVNECPTKTAESELMTAGERRLVSLAAALIGSRGG